MGFDFVELSGGTYERLAFQHMRDTTRKREAFFIEFAEKVLLLLLLLFIIRDNRVKYHTNGTRQIYSTKHIEIVISIQQ